MAAVSTGGFCNGGLCADPDDAVPHFHLIGFDGRAGYTVDNLPGGKVKLGIVPGARNGASIMAHLNFAFAEWSTSMGASVAQGEVPHVRAVRRDRPERRSDD